MAAMEKKLWIDTMKQALLEALERLNSEVAGLQESRHSDTKSSAGDKHETGRAMVDQELAQLRQQLEKTKRLRSDLSGIPEGVFSSAQWGAAVETERMVYFISISHGKVDAAGSKPVYALSPVSPAAQAMMGKQAGEAFELNGTRHVIQSVR